MERMDRENVFFFSLRYLTKKKYRKDERIDTTPPHLRGNIWSFHGYFFLRHLPDSPSSANSATTTTKKEENEKKRGVNKWRIDTSIESVVVGNRSAWSAVSFRVRWIGRRSGSHRGISFVAIKRWGQRTFFFLFWPLSPSVDNAGFRLFFFFFPSLSLSLSLSYRLKLFRLSQFTEFHRLLYRSYRDGAIQRNHSEDYRSIFFRKSRWQ